MAAGSGQVGSDREIVVERFGAIEGGKQTLERLAGYIASSAGNAGQEKGAR